MSELRHGRFYASDEDVHDAVDYWHDHEEIGEPLHVFLGWTWHEYSRWVETGERPMPPAVTPEAYVGRLARPWPPEAIDELHRVGNPDGA